jgi:hypothetical protein
MYVVMKHKEERMEMRLENFSCVEFVDGLVLLDENKKIIWRVFERKIDYAVFPLNHKINESYHPTSLFHVLYRDHNGYTKKQQKWVNEGYEFLVGNYGNEYPEYFL